MGWNALRQLTSPGYRRKTLLLVSLFTALITTLYIGIFSFHIHRQKQITDQQRVKAAAQLLSQVMRSALYAGNIQSLAETAQSALGYFHVSKIKVTLPNGEAVLETPHRAETDMTAESIAITIDQSLAPEASIAQVSLPRQVIGTVTVFSDGSQLGQDARTTVGSLVVTGCLLWVAVSFIGYMMMRRLTSSFDSLVVGIAAIEEGHADQVAITTHDEAASIGKAVNRMSSAMLRREQAKLIGTNKMSSLGLLVSCMGHEINNPNSIIRMQNELIATIIHDAEPVLSQLANKSELQLGGLPFDEGLQLLKEGLISVGEQTERINDVIVNLREYVSGTSLEKEIVAINMAVESIIRLLRPLIKSYAGTLDVVQEAPFPIIAANKNCLQQVVINLVQNALRATADQGNHGKIMIKSWGEGNWAWLSVSDNGTGIHPDDISRLCDPFFSKHLESGGSGLGLFITRQIVDEHDGIMEFISELGKGTTVTIRFKALGEGF